MLLSISNDYSLFFLYHLPLRWRTRTNDRKRKLVVEVQGYELQIFLCKLITYCKNLASSIFFHLAASMTMVCGILFFGIEGYGGESNRYISVCVAEREGHHFSKLPRL